jgi:hypothetical protein
MYRVKPRNFITWEELNQYDGEDKTYSPTVNAGILDILGNYKHDYGNDDVFDDDDDDDDTCSLRDTPSSFPMYNVRGKLRSCTF